MLTVGGPFRGRDFKWGNLGCGVNFWGSGSFVCKTWLDESAEAATTSYSALGDFLQYIYSLLVAKNHQKIRSRCLVHEISFIDIF